MSQKILRLNPQNRVSFDNFYFGDNTEVAQALTVFSQQDNAAYVYLCAPAGEGKSHLLMATQQAVQKAGKQAMYFSLAMLSKHANPAILEGLEQADLVCLDDIESVVGQTEWEEAIFHCFNRLQQAGTSLLIGGAVIPGQLGLDLPDLVSRLETGTLYQLPTLSDGDKQQALQQQAAYRGLVLADNIADYLLRHYGRDMANLMVVLDRLDDASLTEQRRLTIPFVQQVLDA